MIFILSSIVSCDERHAHTQVSLPSLCGYSIVRHFVEIGTSTNIIKFNSLGTGKSKVLCKLVALRLGRRGPIADECAGKQFS